MYVYTYVWMDGSAYDMHTCVCMQKCLLCICVHVCMHVYIDVLIYMLECNYIFMQADMHEYVCIST